MDFEVFSLDNGDYEFNLSDISKKDWQYFIEDIILSFAGNKSVRSVMATVTIRDNNAKIKIAYCDDNYHEVCIRLDEFGTKLSNKNDAISKTWQQFMLARFGKKYLKALAEMGLSTEVNC
ncbi:MAG: hypothetical protein IJW36_01950 [Clostridia bacterium]|nr:hypothetical protein [Clostridia bacterium]